MKRGLPAFTYKEIKNLISFDIDVYCYVMRDGKGIYMPEPNWKVIKIKKIKFIWTLLLFIFSKPKKILLNLISAIKDKGLIDFLISIYFTGHLIKQSIDVIYCFEGKHALWIGYYCHMFTNIPLTVIVHAEMVDTTLKINLTKKALDSCYKIITISGYNKERMIKQFQLSNEKVEVIRLSVDFTEDNSIKVLIVGEFSERKGHETLLRAIQEPATEEFRIWVVGGGAWGSKYFNVEKYIKEHNLQDRVVVWGKVSEEILKLLYKNCDIFCLPSRTTENGIKEGIPVALMEAMFFAKPVISTYHTGIPELVPEILINENDYKALAQALIKLRAPELRKELGLRNKKIVEKNYNKNNFGKIAQILKEHIKET